MKRIGRYAAYAMVRWSHDKFGAGSDLAELSDDEMISKLWIVEQHIVLFKAGRVNGVIIVGVVTNRNIRGSDDIFDKAGSLVLIGKDHIRVWNLFHCFLNPF